MANSPHSSRLISAMMIQEEDAPVLDVDESIQVSDGTVTITLNIADGLFSPPEGFMHPEPAKAIFCHESWFVE